MVTLSHAGTHVWSGAVSGYWNVAANWSSGGVPAAGEANLQLKFPIFAFRQNTTNNIANLSIQNISFEGNNYTLYGKLPGSTLTFASSGGAILAQGTVTVLTNRSH